MLELRALGNAEIQTDTTTLTPSQEIVFASALYLVLERERRVSRSSLAELLWPSVEASARAHRLRQTLLQLKKLGFPVSADRDRVGLATREIRADIDNIEVSGNGAFENQVLEFLPGYSPPFSEPFRDWVDRKRSEINSNSSRALLSLLSVERGRGDWNSVERIARRILRLDPFNESAVLALAESSAMRGQKRQAVTMLDNYLSEVGGNPDIRLPTTLLRKRILDSPNSAPPISLPTPPFVGREVEIERLTRSLKEAQKKRGSACVVTGDPGIGKSRIAAELAKFATLQGIRTATVSCQRSNVDRPLSVLVDLVPLLREMPGAIGCSQETLQILRRLTEFDTRGAELSVATVESHALHRALRNALFDLLDAITDEVSLLLVFDDVQWIDRTSADVLAQMIAWAKQRRFLLVLNTRDARIELLDAIVRNSAEVIELNSLADNASEALVSSIVADRALAPSSGQSRWILDAGEGNPFFLQELAKHWLESGGSAEAPSSVSKVLRDRLAKLSPVSLKVLQACTVLGQCATVDRADKVLEYPSHELLGAIQELSAAGMLSCTADSPEVQPLSLRTRHDLLSNAVLDSLSAASRGFLHRRAGIVLEKELLGDRMSTALLWECAFHWHHAGDRNQALSVVRSCSEHLLEVGLPQLASDALGRALDYCSTDEQRMAVLARQVDALQMAGQWKKSKEVLVRCREIRKRTTSGGDQHDAFEIMLFDASHRSSLDVMVLLRETTLCVECDRASAEHRIQAAVMALKIASDVHPHVMDAIFRHVEPLLGIVAATNPHRIEAEMVYHSIRGDGARGLSAARTLVDIARRSSEPLRLARALDNLGNSCRINGTREEAEACINEAIECSLKHHLVERAALGMQSLVKMRLAVGDLVLARDILRKRNALPIAPENLIANTERHAVEARLALMEGNPAKAAQAFSQIPKVSIEYSPSRRASYLALEIQIRLAEGSDPGTLRPLVTELEKIHTTMWGMGLQDSEAEALFFALRALGEEPRARALVDAYLTTHRRDRMPATPNLLVLRSERPRSSSDSIVAL